MNFKRLSKVEMLARVGGAYGQALEIVQVADLLGTVENAVILTRLTHQLRDAADCSRYLLGGLLAQLSFNDLWRKGDQTFHEEEEARRATEGLPKQLDEPCGTYADFCERHVGLKARTCLFLAWMFKRAVELGMSPSQVDEIGWTKARNILRIATTEDLESWVEKAKSGTFTQLAAEVREATKQKKSPGGQRAAVESIETFKVRVTQDEKNLIEGTIDRAAELLADRKDVLTSRGHALQLICTEWLMNHIPDASHSLAWFVAQLEQHYGKRITVSDHDPVVETGGTATDEGVADDGQGDSVDGEGVQSELSPA